jgi:hypothetical protein
VFGLLFCPVLLQFYSAYLLLMIGLKGLPLGRTGARRFNAAWIFNIGYLLVLGAFFLPIPGWSRVIRTWLDVWMNY